MVTTQVKQAINTARQFHAATQGITREHLTEQRLRFLDGMGCRLWGMCACLQLAHELKLITRDDCDAASKFINGYVASGEFLSSVIGSDKPEDVSAWWDKMVGVYTPPSTNHFETRFNTVL